MRGEEGKTMCSCSDVMDGLVHKLQTGPMVEEKKTKLRNLQLPGLHEAANMAALLAGVGSAFLTSGTSDVEHLPSVQ